MFTKIIVLLATIFVCGCGTVFASSNVDVELSCPASVKVGAALKVTVTPYNDGDSSVTLNRYVATIVANTGDTVGDTGLYGPFAKTLANPKTVAAWSEAAAFSVPVATAPNVANKMAMVVLQFITSTGQDVGGDACWVNIVP